MAIDALPRHVILVDLTSIIRYVIIYFKLYFKLFRGPKIVIDL